MTDDVLTLARVVVGVLAFVGYFAGVVIRKVALPGNGSPSMRDQLLLGIPISLVVVSPLLLTLNAAIDRSNPSSFLVTLGIIMEHGMLLNETLSRHLKERLTAA
jgi:hypothetical protein